MEPESGLYHEKRRQGSGAANMESGARGQPLGEMAERRFRDVSAHLAAGRTLEALYEHFLDTAIAILHSDFASVQVFYPERGAKGELRLVGHRGFGAAAVERWEWVGPAHRTACGEALRSGRRIAVPDVRKCDFMMDGPDLEVYLATGIRAVLVAPLLSRSGSLLGVVSTHWSEPHEPSASECHALEGVARLAADSIEGLRAEEAVWENQQRIASIYDTLRDVIFDLAVEPGNQFRFISVNAAFLRVTGLDREAVIGKTVSEVIPEPSLTLVVRKYRQAIAEQKALLWEETSDYPSGRLTGEVSVTPVFDTAGRCTHLVGSVHDITEARRAQEDAFARQKLEIVGTLANGIAHDFNNILGGILAQVDLALARLESGEVPTDELHAVRYAAVRGAEIVRELLIYAGTESAALVLLDVSHIVEEMLGLLSLSVSKRARIATDLARDLPAVRANPAQISQLLMNLVTNASDAIGDRSGTVRVSTQRIAAAAGGPEKRPSTDRDYVQLEVSDTGCGMKPEIRAKAFEPFFSTKSMGRGIGLAVVDGIVRSLGGIIELESESGQGTTVRISLPAAATSLPAALPAPSDTQDGGRPAEVTTVLLVEDEALLRLATSKMLSKAGIVIIEAADGESALNAIRNPQNRIDVVVLDITVPGASSREIFEEAMRLRPDVRVIVTSAYGEDVAAASLRSSIRHFLRKPYQLADLAALLRTVG